MRRGFALLLSLLPACAATGSCPRGGVCGAASWQGSAIDQALRVHPVVAIDEGDGREAPSFSVSPRGVRVRFDLRALPPGAAIGRAVLSLREAEGPPRAQSVTLRARALLAPWRVGAADETPRGSESTAVTIPRGARGPVRLDVTEALREALAWGQRPDGLALETEGGTLRLVGPWDALGAPRLEVAAR